MRHRSTETMGLIQRFVEGFYLEHIRSPSTGEIAEGTGIP